VIADCTEPLFKAIYAVHIISKNRFVIQQMSAQSLIGTSELW